MILNSVFRWLAVLSLIGFSTNGWTASYDPAASFEQGFLGRSNPNGVWSYGYSTSFTGPTSLYTETSQPGTNNVNEQYWSSSPNITATSSVAYNDGPAFNNGNVDFLANQLLLVEFGTQYADLVFTAPTAGMYSVAGNFRGDQNGIGVVTGVIANGTVLLSSGIQTGRPAASNGRAPDTFPPPTMNSISGSVDD
jgi:hypothetical protein